MRILCIAVPALVAGCAGAQSNPPESPLQPQARAAPLEYRSAVEDYRRFAEPELADWRKANDEVRAAGGHAGHQPGQGGNQR